MKKGRWRLRGSFSKWRNVKMGRKYLTIFILVAVLFFLAGGLVFLQQSTVQDDINQIEQESVRANEMAQIASIIQAKDVQISDFIITKNQQYVTEFQELRDQLTELESKLESEMHTDLQQAIFSKVQANDSQINDMFLNEIAVDTASNEELSALRDQSSSLRISTVELVNQLIEIVNEEQSATVKNAQASLDSSIFILITAGLLAIGIGILLVLLISRNITGNLKNVVGLTSKVATGDLSAESVDYEGKDEIGQLSDAVNQMKDNIRKTLLRVADASKVVSSRSEELTQSANEVKEGNEQIALTMEELSTGSETQANSASNLASSMNDFVKKVYLSEQNGQEIAVKSDNVIQLTIDGTSLMNKSVNQMKRIDTIVSEAVNKVQGLDKQSDQISKLVLVIKDIADQTNLLSLNAAIEAARAGEHGKGFAVVADEVRKLAEQVTSSVSEITGIVTSIQSETSHVVGSLSAGYDEVREGTTQIEATGQNFESIHTAVSDMADKIKSISGNLKDIAENSNDMNNLIEEVASVSEESAAGIEQVAASAQQTSSSMEEVTYSADELAKLAEDLNKEVNVFKL